MPKSKALAKSKSTAAAPGGGNLVPTPPVVSAYQAYLERIAPRDREEIREALAAHEDPRFRDFLTTIFQQPTWTLAQCAGRAKLGFREMMEFVTKVQGARALAITQVAAIHVNQDMADDSRSRFVLCERCDGLQRVPCEPMDLGAQKMGERVVGDRVEEVWNRPCPQCDGRGKIREPGDTRSRELILEQAGLVRQKGGGGVQITQNFGGSALPDSRVSALTIDLEEEG